ncbi:hypothetical protein H5410_019335, partial [Solanum commersonii]
KLNRTGSNTGLTPTAVTTVEKKKTIYLRSTHPPRNPHPPPYHQPQAPSSKLPRRVFFIPEGIHKIAAVSSCNSRNW